MFANCLQIKYEIEHEPNDNPVLMPFPTRHFQTKKKACVAVEDSYWSDDFPLDTVGNSGRIVCKDKHDHEYELSVDVKLCNSRLTKIVTFTAFYLLQNNGRFAVEIKEYGCNNTWIEIPPETVSIQFNLIVIRACFSACLSGRCNVLFEKWPAFGMSVNRKNPCCFRLPRTSTNSAPSTTR